MTSKQWKPYLESALSKELNDLDKKTINKMAKPKCLRCEKADAYTKKGFTSAWCPKCHLEKFGRTHEETEAKKIKLPIKAIK